MLLSAFSGVVEDDKGAAAAHHACMAQKDFVQQRSEIRLHATRSLGSAASAIAISKDAKQHTKQYTDI